VIARQSWASTGGKNSLEQFTTGAQPVILWPAKYKTGDALSSAICANPKRSHCHREIRALANPPNECLVEQRSTPHSPRSAWFAQTDNFP